MNKEIKHTFKSLYPDVVIFSCRQVEDCPFEGRTLRLSTDKGVFTAMYLKILGTLAFWNKEPDDVGDTEGYKEVPNWKPPVQSAPKGRVYIGDGFILTKDGLIKF